MHVLQNRAIVGLLMFFCVGISLSTAQNYFTPTELNQQFEKLAAANSSKMKIHKLATSPGGNSVILVEIGTETGKNEKTKPAIFVTANPEGITPIASYASVNFANLLLKDEKQLKFTWYILPSLNPDALTNYFSKVKEENPRNGLAVNDDQDDATDEDGADDLNNDGFITQMRVKNPQGTWIIDETDARLMRRADAAKGEKGIYSLYTEGIDNDNDGEYGEDPKGGTNTGVNFPHLFKSFTASGGAWPGSTPEVYSVMKFIYEHPEIAATFTFGSTNFCLTPPEGGRKGSADFNRIRIPDDMVDMLGAEKGKTYTMDEVIELAQPMVPAGVELTPSMVASFLGLGAVVNPLPDDLVWYKELSEQYLEYLKKVKFETDRLEAEKAKDGSFELWSYYHLGLPTFSFNFFTLPKAKEEKKDGTGISLEKLEGMTAEEVIALGEEKIAAFLKENNAPAQFKAAQVIDMLKAGQTNPKQMAGMLKSAPKPKKAPEADSNLKALLAYSDKNLGGKAYVNWQAYKHPTLGDVEIGGAVPFAFNTPPAAKADSLINLQLPWVFNLTDKLPNLKIADYKAKSLGAGVYSLDIWVENTNYLPFPTAMGKRNNQPAPAILTLEADGLEFLNGTKRNAIRSVDGMKAVKLSFVVKLTKGNSIKAVLESKTAGTDSKEIKL